MEIIRLLQQNGADGLGDHIRIVGGFCRTKRPGDGLSGYSKPEPDPGKPQRLGTGLENNAVVICGKLRQHTLIPEIHIRFVQDHQAIQCIQQTADLSTT